MTASNDSRCFHVVQIILCSCEDAVEVLRSSVAVNILSLRACLEASNIYEGKSSSGSWQAEDFG
jgi:hypothetical protein